MRFWRVFFCVVSVLYILSGQAFCGDKIFINSDEAKIIPVNGNPAGIIIGNAAFADAFVNQGKLVIQGKIPGQTNMIILDKNAHPVASFDVMVGMGDAADLTVFRGGLQFSSKCTPLCQAQVVPGDMKEYSTDVAAQFTLKTGFSNDSAAPSAAGR